jgi:hypothetical protein
MLGLCQTRPSTPLIPEEPEKPVPAIVSLMHKTFPFIDVLGTGVTLYLLLNRTP